jgi:hypothetical protein
LDLEPGRPADPVQGVDERAALDAERSADRGFAGPAVERRDHRRGFLGIDRRGTTASTTATACSSEPGLDPLLGQGTFKLRQRAEDMKQEFAPAAW